MSALAVSSFAGVAVKVQAKRATVCRASALVTKAGAYDEELMTSLPANLRAAIGRRGLKITAAAAECKIPRVTFQRYLCGTREPSLDQLAAIARALGTTVSRLTKGI